MRFKQYILDILEEAAAHIEAEHYAEMKHAGQVRKFSGKPYATHPQKVAQIVMNFKKSKNLDVLMAAAHLHDTIEDTDTTFTALQKEFGNLIASIVEELTSDPVMLKKLGKTRYLTDKMIHMSDYALVIKLADRLQNVSDLVSGSPKRSAKYAKETEDILKELESKRTLTRSQAKLVKAIKRTVKEFRLKQNEV